MSDLISRQDAIDACLKLLEVRRKWDTAEGRAEMRGINAVLCTIYDLSPTLPEIIRCKDCKYAHMTYNGECKYCDIWFPDEKTYTSGDYFCGSAERREG